MNFSLRAFLLAVPVIAVGISGYVFQLQWATSLSYTICVAMLLFAAVGAVFGRHQRRLFWAGFAVLGWGYWYMAFDSARFSQTHVSVGRVSADRLSYSASGETIFGQATRKEYHFVTSDILDFVERHVTPSKRVGSRVMALWSGNSYFSATITERNGANYLVKWDDGSVPKWVTDTQIRAFGPTSRAAAHSLFCLLFALGGGAAAVWLFRERSSDVKKDVSPSPLS